MEMNSKIEHLTIPVVITGNHAELLAKDGRRLCARAVLLDRIGELEPDVAHTVLWRGWCRGLSSWKGCIQRARQIQNDAWKRKIANWASRATRRIIEQPPYKGLRPRIPLCRYADWDEAVSKMLHQIRSKRTYYKQSRWSRWATFAVNNARKRKGAQS